MAENSDQSAQEHRSAEELLGEGEPWESWETQLVVWSIGIGIVGLIILGWLINTFILH
ncbi:MAG: hypothetical protein ABFS45_13675 [Pseudomonadota bacterium]